MFFERIDQAADWLGTVDLIHSNGTIQYVPDALETVRTLCSVRPAMLAWYRVPISEETRREVQTSYLSDNGPGSSLASKEKLVRYERNWISEQAFIQAHEGFRITERSPIPPSAARNNSGSRGSSLRQYGGDVFDKFADWLRQTAFFSTAIDIARQTLPEPALIWLRTQMVRNLRGTPGEVFGEIYRRNVWG